MSKIIPLTQGEEAIVDDRDFEYLNQWKWRSHNGYAIRAVGPFGKQKTIHMHRLIMNTPEGMETDHINRNRLDNRRENLRNCTRLENLRNMKMHKDNASGYKGISKTGKKWRAQLSVKGKDIHSGSFVSKIDAAKAYDELAREYFGEFARCNF